MGSQLRGLLVAFKLDRTQPVLVTGAGGVIGQALLKELGKQGFSDVTGITSRECDLRNTDATTGLMNRVKPALVFHMAARVAGIMGNMRDRALAYVDNIRINTNVIDAAHNAGAKKIVAMGTTAIYSDIVPLPMREDDIWAGPPHLSEAPYGHAKRAMLAQLEAYKEQYGLEYAYCVSTNLYGPHDKFDEQHGHVLPSLVSKFFRAARDGDAVTVWGDGSPQRDFLFSQDAAVALCMIAENGSGAINLASGKFVTIRDVATLLAEIAGVQSALRWDATKPNGQMLRQYSVERLEALGFETRHSLREGLEKTYNWYCENHQSVRR